VPARATGAPEAAVPAFVVLGDVLRAALDPKVR
jgi:hypothetical protein